MTNFDDQFKKKIYTLAGNEVPEEEGKSEMSNEKEEKSMGMLAGWAALFILESINRALAGIVNTASINEAISYPYEKLGSGTKVYTLILEVIGSILVGVLVGHLTERRSK